MREMNEDGGGRLAARRSEDMNENNARASS